MPRFRLQLNRPYGVISVEAESVEEIAASLNKLVELSNTIDKSLGLASPAAQQQAPSQGRSRRRRGSSEAVLALDTIERQILGSGFFSTPRSTSEVRQKIYELTGLRLQSRKVSQALGILYESKKIMRVGSRGNYRWFEK
ncbi:hypothetical protein HRbin02_00368 [Candidatus Calditenuaceae archaeon HR02]|nr:hypothetical protein HRbin02_00368 [Candidatus Calditenuaceae archaeon HR02]